MAAVPIAYSYVRFSTPEQKKGNSLQRQTEVAAEWCARHGACLDTSRTYHDLGKSAYMGEHRSNPDRHALAAFVSLVEKGRIVRGSFLIVESLDRLTREDILPALGLLIDLIQAGIRVVQLLPVETIYDQNVNPMHLMMAIMELSRGHSESAMRSQRVGGAWREKKRRAAADGEALTARGPSWLRLVDGRWEVDEPRAEVVRRVYRLAAAGYGQIAITKKLNAERVPTFGKATHWPRSYVAKLLADRRPIGEYQPYKGRAGKRKPDGDPIAGYYPSILTEEDWYATRAGLAARRGKPGRPPRDRINVFAGLIRDARDGGALHLADKGKKSQRVLAPYKASQGVEGCSYVSFPFATFERAILSCLSEIDPSAILPEQDKGADKALVIAGRLAEVEVEIEKVKGRLQARYSDAVADVLERHEAESKTLVLDLAAARQEATSPLGEAWSECRSLLEVLDAASDHEEAYLRLRALLRRIVEGFWCVFVARGAKRLAAVQVWFAGGEHRDFLILHRPATAGAVGARPGGWCVRSSTLPTLDFRVPENVSQLETLLNEIDLQLLTDAMR